MRYWLMKSEPSDVSIDDLAALPAQTVAWYGIRNYQARNFMRDQMRVWDKVLFYHSSCAEPGIAGLAEVSRLAYPDETQFDQANKYFDPKAIAGNAALVQCGCQAGEKNPTDAAQGNPCSPRARQHAYSAKG